MSWWAVDFSTTREQRDALAAWLVGRSGQAIEERDDGTLVSFAPDHAAAMALIAEAQQTCGYAVTGAARELPEIDWSTRWRDGIEPRHVGRLTVVPSWVDATPFAGQVIVTIDPETAFGSGEHGSTRAALALLERLLEPEDVVVDFGSGSGILAIAAARLGAARATGIEIDAEANAVAARNAETNGVSDRCTFLDGDAGSLGPLLGPADLVVSNILRTVNTELLGAITRTLRPGGIAIFSGMEDAEEALFRSALALAGFDVVRDTHDAGWWAVAARV
ncbi:MAG: 50S ribosomal protein L11 methyltransferase [Gemmatimonadota bacterium]